MDLLPSLNSLLNLTLANLFNSFATTNFGNIAVVFKNFLRNVYYGVASGHVDNKNTIYMSKESHILENWEKLASNNNFSENIDSSQRFNRFSNALINYDYKTGNYVGYWEGKYPHLINIFIEIARGVKKPT